MPRRKRPNPAATHGWEGEARQEDIDSAVGSHLRCDGERTYRQTYEQAKRRLDSGERAEQIRESLHREPDLQEFSAEDSPSISDYKTIHNRVEEHLCRIIDQAIDDALAGRKLNYQHPPGY